MKKLTKKQMAKNIVKNLSKLIFGLIWRKLIVDNAYRLKWLGQYVMAKINGFKNHAYYMQKMLNISANTHI